MNRLKIIKELKENIILKITIFLLFLTYILLKKNDKYIYLYLISLLSFSYVLVRIYYEKIVDEIKLCILIFIDMTYLFLCQFNLIYIILGVLVSIFFIYSESKKVIRDKGMYIAIEFVSIYTIFKLFIILSMIFV